MKENIIYIRTSTEEQNPENQLKDCIEFSKKLSIEDFEILEDKVTGWTEIERESFDKIKLAIDHGNIKSLIVWDIDRIYRNRKRLIAFFELCKIKKCNIFSFRQDWLQEINKMPPPFNEMMHSLMLQVMGWIAEEESTKKSQRVKISVRRKEGEPTKSYKGNKWGRKSISPKIMEQIKQLRDKGLSYSQICKEVSYNDKNNNKKQVSKTLVNKVLVGEYSQ